MLLRNSSGCVCLGGCVLWNKEIRPTISGITCKITPALGLGVDKSTSYPSLCERWLTTAKVTHWWKCIPRGTPRHLEPFFGVACPRYLVEGTGLLRSADQGRQWCSRPAEGWTGGFPLAPGERASLTLCCGRCSTFGELFLGCRWGYRPMAPADK